MVDYVDPIDQQFDWALLAILFGLMLFLPAAMATHEYWNEAIALDIAFAAVAVLGVKLIVRPEQRLIWSWTFVPIVALVAIVLFEMIPLPQGVMRAIAPTELADRLKLAAVLPAEMRPDHFSLSFYPYGTMHDLRNLLVTIAVFIVSLNISRRASQLKLLLWAVAVVGAASAALQMAQVLTGASAVYWTFKLPLYVQADSGTFPNHNFFAQFTNISCGAALALFLMAMDETFHRHDYTPAELMEKFSSRPFRKAYVLLAIMSLDVTSVFLSLSRGGVLSIVIAGVLTAILLALRGGRRGMGMAGWFGLLVMVFVFMLIVASGAEAVESRIKRIGNADDRYDRMQMTKDTLNLWRHYPLMGSGLGSFRFVFPRFDGSSVEATATHAEDEYVELLAEVGIAGSVCIAAFGVMIAWSFLQTQARGKRGTRIPPETNRASDRSAASRGLEHRSDHRGGEHHRRSGSSIASSLAIGISFGLLAMLVQSTTDFALHFLPVSCEVAVLCAVLINVAALRRVERGINPPLTTEYPSGLVVIRRRLIRGGSLLVSISAMVVLAVQANRAWAAEDAFHRSDDAAQPLVQSNWKDAGGQVADMNRNADEMVRLAPDDVLYKFSQATDRGYSVSPALSAEQRHSEFLTCTTILQRACLSCPTDGPIHSQIGQWQQNELGLAEAGAESIRLSAWLAPHTSTVQYIMGGVDADDQKWPQATQDFKEAVALSTEILPDVISACVDQYHRPEMLLAIAGTNVAHLQTVADELRQREKALTPPAAVLPAAPLSAVPLSATSGTPTSVPTTAPEVQAVIEEDENVARQADQAIDVQVSEAAGAPDASAVMLSKMAQTLVQKGEIPRSLTYFQRALTKDYGDAATRLAYAQSLTADSNDNEASRQLQILLRQQPTNDAARALLDKVLVRQAKREMNVEQTGSGLGTQKR